MRMSNAVLSVAGLIQQVKSTLDQNVLLKSFYVKGEISNFTAHHNGHWYFSLKDEQARIQCVMFQSYARAVVVKPKEGMKVLLRAGLSVYPVQGQLQCTVFSMESDGIGDLYLQFEQLKKRLFDEGYFDPAHKQAIPAYPMTFGIITGRNTAALQDILQTFRLRWPLAQLVVYSSLVQGDQASTQLIKKLLEADNNHHDVLILARGGGSIEDLWAFNDEKLAKTIFTLKTPLITGIGHETDTTIADMVADLRAPTPTGAVQAAVKNYRDVQADLFNRRRYMVELLNKTMQSKHHQVQLIQKHRLFKEPQAMFMSHYLALSQVQKSLMHHTSIIEQQRHRLMQHYQKLMQRKTDAFEPLKQQLNQHQFKMRHLMQRNLDLSKQKFATQLSLIEAYSPLAILSRGYSIVSSNNQVINSIQDLHVDQMIDIQLKDGQALAKVTKKGH